MAWAQLGFGAVREHDCPLEFTGNLLGLDGVERRKDTLHASHLLCTTQKITAVLKGFNHKAQSK